MINHIKLFRVRVKRSSKFLTSPSLLVAMHQITSYVRRTTWTLVLYLPLSLSHGLLSFEQVARLRCVAQAGLELVTFLPKPVRVLGLQISATMPK